LFGVADPSFSIPHPKPKSLRNPRSGSATKNLSIFDPKIVTKLLEIGSGDVYFGSLIQDPDFFP
jgi:hypothetical protein